MAGAQEPFANFAAFCGESSLAQLPEFREKLDQNLNGISGKIDRSHDLLSHRLDVLSVRMDEVRSLVDRVDERTKHPEATPRTTGTT